MKSFAWALVFALIPSTCIAESEPFAPANRFVSVVQYHIGPGFHWTVWAVQQGKLTIYSQTAHFKDPGKLLAEVSISKVQESKIREAAVALSKEAKGKAWYTPDIIDGLALGVQFSGDGARRDDGIMLENVWRLELRDLCESISAAAPPELKITFSDLILEDPNHARHSVKSIALEEYWNRFR